MMHALWSVVAGCAIAALAACPEPADSDAAAGDAGRDAAHDGSAATDGTAQDSALADRTAVDAAGRDGGWYRPGVATTWQWQLTGTVNTNYDVDLYDIDLFETELAFNQSLQTAGRRVLCYFSAGSAENWRPDYGQFASGDLGNDLDGWAGERWVDVRSTNVRNIMLARLDQAQNKGCDGVEPDNVEGIGNNPGIDYTANDQLAYIRFLATAAHDRGLAIALKNDLPQVTALVDAVDLMVNEECHQFGTECDLLQPFINAGKPVLNAEYANSLSAAQNLATTLCPQALSENFRTLILPLDLDDAFRVSCD